MVTTTETMQISSTKDRKRQNARAWDYGGLFVVGVLVGCLSVVAVQVSTPLTPTEVTMRLLIGATILTGLIVFINISTRFHKDDLVERIVARADRNRNATEAVRHGQDELRTAVECGARANQELRHAIVEASARVSGEVDTYTRTVQRQSDELARLTGLVEWLAAQQRDLSAMTRRELRACRRPRVRRTVQGVEAGGVDPTTVRTLRRLNRRLQE